MEYLLILAFILFIVFGYSAIRLGNKEDKIKYTKVKCIASFMFLVISFLCYLISRNEIYFALLPGYIACFSGDLFLGLYQVYNKEKSIFFKIGLLSFLLAHIFYVAKYIGLMGEFNLLNMIVPIIMAIVVIVMAKKKLLLLGHGLLPFCVSYIIIVSLMASLGVNLAIFYKAPLIGLGSICFLCSDSIIALKYFGRNKKKWYHTVELSLYYVAMLTLSTLPIYLELLGR